MFSDALFAEKPRTCRAARNGSTLWMIETTGLRQFDVQFPKSSGGANRLKSSPVSGGSLGRGVERRGGGAEGN